MVASLPFKMTDSYVRPHLGGISDLNLLSQDATGVSEPKRLLENNLNQDFECIG